MTRLNSFLSTLAILLSVAARAPADPPGVLTVHPARVSLAGGRAEQQLLVTWKCGTGSLADRTRTATYISLQPKIASVSPAGLVIPHHNGSTEIIIKANDLETKVPVT